MLNVGVVQTVGGCPAVTVVAATARWQGMKRGRFAFAKLRVVGGGGGTHGAHIDRAGRGTYQHQLAEGDVVQAEVVAIAIGVLVQDGNGGCSG